MKRSWTLAVVFSLLAAVAPATGAPAAPAASPRAAAWPRGVHPWPRGDEWPRGLSGPFARQEPVAVAIRSFDGVVLRGWVQRPAVPNGVRVPVVLVSSPYFGQTVPTGDTDEKNTPRWLVDHGYAVASINVRGTGNSGGCLGFFGPDEQRDQAVLVEWLGTQPWSNGRVGMYGLSYPGTTPWEAAIQNPPHLKTIVVAGMVGDAYNFFHTPQGAPLAIGAAFGTAYTGLVSGAPPLLGSPTHGTVDHLPVVPERACEENRRFNEALWNGMLTDDRDPAFWQARRLADRFDDVRAAVFVTHGFRDLWGSGHAFQEDYVWRMLRRAPKRWLEGQWAHEFPTLDSWRASTLEWLEFWLKGVGGPPGVGRVDYADGAGTWRRTTAWPPPARQEVLHLAGRTLSGTPGGQGATIVAVPSTVTADSQPIDMLCSQSPVDGTPGRAIVATTAPATTPVHIAGNPFAYLRLRSDQPGGLVGLQLVELGPGFACAGAVPTGRYRFLTTGAADLRFHAGGYTGTPFPVGRWTGVRVDLASMAETLRPGYRLALVASAGDVTDRWSQPHPARVEFAMGTAGASHLVIPVREGTFGGAKPTLRYPRNPFPGWTP